MNEWFNAACFSAPPTGELGNLGRDTLQGPGFWNFDFAVMKNTRVTERLTAQLRVEAFNIFNHPDFALPNASLFTLSANRYRHSQPAGRPDHEHRQRTAANSICIEISVLGMQKFTDSQREVTALAGHGRRGNSC